MTLRLTVIGTGYLGAVHAACMADLGFEVLGFDTSVEKVQALSKGHAPFFEPGLDEVLARALASGRLRFTNSVQEVADFGDVHFLCVGTPQTAGAEAADLSQVNAAVDALAPLLARPTLVVGKSTVPVGTAERLAARIAQLAPAGAEAELAWNPEFLREGFAVHDTLHPDRLVLGVRSSAAERALRDVYASLIADGVPVIVTDFATAELVKGAANAFLSTKISFINAMAELCEATGADVTVLAEALGHDPRIGHRFLRAGLGFGGGCLPKDLRAFVARAEELGVQEAFGLLHEVDAINQRRRAHAITLTRELLGGSLDGAVIACLGASFKPDSDDVRDSPALHVADELRRAGARVRVTDPHALANAAQLFPELEFAPSVDEAVAGADVVLLLTEWTEYRALTPQQIDPLVRQRRILDARAVLDLQQWRDAGWTARALGRP